MKERREKALHLVGRLIDDFGYTETSAGLVLGYFHRHHDELQT